MDRALGSEVGGPCEMRNGVVEEWDQVKNVEIRTKTQQRTDKRPLLECVTHLCVRRDVGGGWYCSILLVGGLLETKHVLFWLLLFFLWVKEEKNKNNNF